MNSMSLPHFNDKKYVCCKKENAAKVLLKCNTGSSVVVPVVPLLVPAISRLATLNLNIDQFNLSCIRLEFSTNVISTFIAIPGASQIISFQLFKLCRGETFPVAIGGPWVFTRPIALNDIITFTVCDCDCDRDTCCSYYIESASSLTVGGSASLIFNDTTLSALVVEKNCTC